MSNESASPKPTGATKGDMPVWGKLVLFSIVSIVVSLLCRIGAGMDQDASWLLKVVAIFFDEVALLLALLAVGLLISQAVEKCRA